MRVCFQINIFKTFFFFSSSGFQKCDGHLHNNATFWRMIIMFFVFLWNPARALLRLVLELRVTRQTGATIGGQTAALWAASLWGRATQPYGGPPRAFDLSDIIYLFSPLPPRSNRWSKSQSSWPKKPEARAAAAIHQPTNTSIRLEAKSRRRPFQINLWDELPAEMLSDTWNDQFLEPFIVMENPSGAKSSRAPLVAF